MKSGDVTSHLIKLWNSVLQKVVDFAIVGVAAENNWENSQIKIHLDLEDTTSPLLLKALDLQIATVQENILQTYHWMRNPPFYAFSCSQCWPAAGRTLSHCPFA